MSDINVSVKRKQQAGSLYFMFYIQVFPQKAGCCLMNPYFIHNKTYLTCLRGQES